MEVEAATSTTPTTDIFDQALILKRGTLHRAKSVLRRFVDMYFRYTERAFTENDENAVQLSSSFFSTRLRLYLHIGELGGMSNLPRIDEEDPFARYVTLFRIDVNLRDDRPNFLLYVERALGEATAVSSSSSSSSATANLCSKRMGHAVRRLFEKNIIAVKFAHSPEDRDEDAGRENHDVRFGELARRVVELVIDDEASRAARRCADRDIDGIPRRYGFSKASVDLENLTSDVVLRDDRAGKYYATFVEARRRFVARAKAETTIRNTVPRSLYFDVVVSRDCVGFDSEENNRTSAVTECIDDTEIVRPNTENVPLSVTTEKDVKEYGAKSRRLLLEKRKKTKELDANRRLMGLGTFTASKRRSSTVADETTISTTVPQLNAMQALVLKRSSANSAATDAADHRRAVIFVNSDAGTGKSVLASEVARRHLSSRDDSSSVLYILPTHRLRSRVNVAERRVFTCTLDAFLHRILVPGGMSVSPGQLWRFVVDDFERALDTVCAMRRGDFAGDMRRVRADGSSAASTKKQKRRCGHAAGTDGAENGPIEMGSDKELPEKDDAAPRLVIVDEAAMCDWRKIYLVREACRRIGSDLLLFGDSCQNSPLYGNVVNAENITLLCCDEMWQLSRNVRSGDDDRCERLLAHFRSGLSGSLLRGALALTLPREVFANGAVDCGARVYAWARDLSRWTTAGSRTWPPFLQLPRLMSLSNRRVDRINHALQSLMMRALKCAFDERRNEDARKQVCLLSRRILVRREPGKLYFARNGDYCDAYEDNCDDESASTATAAAVTVLDESCCNELLLAAGAPYRFIGDSFKNESGEAHICRDSPVVLVALDRPTDRVGVLPQGGDTVIWLRRDSFEERRMSNRRQGDRFFGFPLVLDAAVTQFKAQGETFERCAYPDVYVDANGMDDRSLYVAVSRVESFDQYRGFVGLV